MRKHFLEDITFLIPVRIDSIIRLENLLLSIDNITNYYHKNNSIGSYKV